MSDSDSEERELMKYDDDSDSEPELPKDCCRSTKDKAKACVLTIVGIVQLAVFIYACVVVRQERKIFEARMPRNSEVHTIQHPDYWMPLHAIVPHDCADIDQFKVKKLLEEPSATDKLKGALSIGVGASIRSNVGGRRLDSFEVSLCNGNKTSFEEPTGAQHYFAMLWLQTGGETTVDEIITTRWGLYYWLCFSMALQIFQSAVQTSCGRNGNLQYHIVKAMSGQDAADRQFPPPKNSRCCSDIPEKLLKGMKKILVSIPAKASLLLNQFVMLSLFAVYGQEGYFLMSYIPGVAYILMCVFMTLYFLFVVLLFVSVTCKWENPQLIMVPYGIFSCFSCVFVVLCGIPMVVYSFYNIQFLWQEHVNDVMKEQTVFSVEWPSKMQIASDLSKGFFGLDVVDVVVDSALTVV